MTSLDFMLRTIRRIYASDRFYSYSSMRQTWDTVETIMREMGLTQVETLRYPSDGVTDYAGWLMPLAWDPDDAILSIVQSDGSEKKLCSYREIPCSLGLYSRSADVTAELALYSDADLSGKIVLVADHSPWIPEMMSFIHRGALGIVQSHIGFGADRANLPEFAYLNSESRKWLNYQLPFWEIPENPFVFSITPDEGRQLEAQLKQGKVTLHARIDVEMKKGEIGLVTGFLPGETDEEIVLTGHLFEQGANDNASGVAQMLAIVRELKEKPRRRGIRLLFTHEAKSLQAYVNTLKTKPEFVAGLNVDMVGASLDKVGGIGDSAPAFPTFATPLLKHCLEKHGFSAQVGGITGIDASLAEPYFGTAFTYLEVLADANYHKSSDTPERIDPVTLSTTFKIDMEYVETLVNAGLAEAMQIAKIVRDYDHDTPYPAKAAPAMQYEIAVKRLNSVKKLVSAPEDQLKLSEFLKTLYPAPIPETPPSPPADAELAMFCPVKNYRGFFSFEKYWLKDESHPEIAQLYQGWGAPAWIDDAMMWADGSRSAWEIWCRLRDSGNEIDLELYRHTLHFLQAENYLKTRCFELPPRKYKELNQLFPVTTSVEMAEDALKKLGVCSGMKLVVHSAFRSLGTFPGGARKFCELLQELVTPDGTLMMPALSKYPNDGETILFDPENTPTRTGILSETFRTMPGVVRSLDPTHSFAVWGKDKLDFVKTHHLYPSLHIQSPLGKLEAADGWCLLISCAVAVTFMHVVETTAGAACLGSRTEEYNAVVNGKPVKLRGWGWRDGNCRAFDPQKIYDFMRRKGTLQERMLQRSHWMLFKLSDYREAYERLLRDPVNGCANCPVRPRQVAQCVPSDWDFEHDRLKPTTAFTGDYVPLERK